MKVHARKLRNSEAEGSGNEGSSENSTSDTDNEGTEEEEEGSWRNGGEGKEVKKVTKRKDENPKKGRREKVVDRDKIDNKSPHPHKIKLQITVQTWPGLGRGCPRRQNLPEANIILHDAEKSFLFDVGKRKL